MVTGGARGLGAELVKGLLEKVGQVIVLDVQKGNLPQVDYIHCDLQQDVTTQITKIMNRLEQEGKHITVLVNNAGVRKSGSLLSTTAEDIACVFSVNLFAQITLIKTIVQRHIAKHSRSQLSIVNVLLILGTLAPKNLSMYSASKAAMIQVHESFAQEVKHENIQTLLVTPGQLDTQMFADVEPSRRFFAPIVSHARLAQQIINKVNKGEGGVLCEPLYANFLPVVRSLPMQLQAFCRWFSQMDTKIS